MDKKKFLKASAILSAFKANLPKGGIGLNHVEDYHALIDDLQEQLSEDLNEFRIPKSAIKQHVIANSVIVDMFGNMSGEPYSYIPYCDGDVFRRQLDALLIFVESYMQELQADLKAKRDNG